MKNFQIQNFNKKIRTKFHLQNLQGKLKMQNLHFYFKKKTKIKAHFFDQD